MPNRFRDYDRKPVIPEDEDYEQEQRRIREERRAERAEEQRDRETDERRQEAEMERRMLHGD